MTAEEYAKELNFSKFLGSVNLKDVLTQRDFLGINKTEEGYILTLTPNNNDIFELNTTTRELKRVTANDKPVKEKAVTTTADLANMVEGAVKDLFTPIRTYTLQDIADILKVSRQTIYNYVTADKLKATKYGKEYRVLENDLQDFLKNGHN